jgi:CRP-like cAMP-binding protein
MSEVNALLASLSAGDTAALKPHLRLIDCNSKALLMEAGDLISTVYFPTSCVISLVVGLASGEMIEAAMVGRDGVVGAAAALDGRKSLSRAIVQLPGKAFACPVEALAAVAFQSKSLISTLMRHEQALFAQAQQSTACMATHDVQARFARWLLRARDLAESNTLPFTQEFLAEMLGVRRTSISPVAHTFQQAGIIRYTRGRIEIVNVEALKDSACECYEAIRTNYQDLLNS